MKPGRFEYLIFILFGVFHIHRIWGLIDRQSYTDFWLGLMQGRGVIYYLLMSMLAGACIYGIVMFFKNLNHNFWWRWIYIFGGGYVLFDLFAIAIGWDFWQELILKMFDVDAWYWNLEWGAFIALGVFSLLLGINIKRGTKSN